MLSLRRVLVALTVFPITAVVVLLIGFYQGGVAVEDAIQGASTQYALVGLTAMTLLWALRSLVGSGGSAE